jgi:hypothetical protein
MNKFVLIAGLAAVSLSQAAAAHPTDILFDSFGACNAALQQQNKTDRILHGDAFPNNGAAEIRMLNDWQCVYDPDLNAWHMDGAPFGGDLLGNGNGNADPGTPNN